MEDLIAWAESIGLRLGARGGDEIVRLNGPQVSFTIGEHHEVYPVEASSAGHDRTVLGVFEDIEDARRFLAMELGMLLRYQERMPQLTARELPPGFVIEHAPTALWLSWFTGSAEFPRGEPSRVRAVNFSRVERAPIEQIRSCFGDQSGRPLFDAA